MDRVTNATLRRQRQIQTALVVIILITLPFYCLGAILLLTSGPSSRPARTPTVVPLTLTNPAGNVTAFPSITAVIIPTNTPGSIQVFPTNTPLVLFPTQPQFPTLTFTPFRLPSNTPIPFPTETPIIIQPTSPIFPTQAQPTIGAPATLTPSGIQTLAPSVPTLSPTPVGFKPTPTRAKS